MKTILVRTIVLVVALASWVHAQNSVPQQLLINPDFSMPLVDGVPPGWIKAVSASSQENLEMGVERDEQGPYLYLEQNAPGKTFLNNWAQSIRNLPIGAKIRLEIEVATQNAQEAGGIVSLYFFDKKNQILRGSVSSKDRIDLSGTHEWTKVTTNARVAEGTYRCSVQVGLHSGVGKIMARHARLYLLGNEEPAPDRTTSAPAGWELLSNGSFDEVMRFNVPIGWLRAMMPDQTHDLYAGLEPMDDRGQVAFIKQEGVKTRLANNWAQRLDTVPRGARLKLTAEVKTQNLPENTGFVMLQCWNRGNKLVAAGTTQGSHPIGGTEDWKTVSFEVDVPIETESIIVRCGLAQSGQIWFDNVSLKVISAPESGQQSPTVSERGFRVTEASLSQLRQVQGLADELARLSAERMGSKSQVRREVYAQPDGTYEVVIYLDLGQ